MAATPCSACGRENARFRCSACGVAVYCDAACQKTAWRDKEHSLTCGYLGDRKRARSPTTGSDDERGSKRMRVLAAAERFTLSVFPAEVHALIQGDFPLGLMHTWLIANNSRNQHASSLREFWMYIWNARILGDCEEKIRHLRGAQHRASGAQFVYYAGGMQMWRDQHATTLAESVPDSFHDRVMWSVRMAASSSALLFEDWATDSLNLQLTFGDAYYRSPLFTFVISMPNLGVTVRIRHIVRNATGTYHLIALFKFDSEIDADLYSQCTTREEKEAYMQGHTLKGVHAALTPLRVPPSAGGQANMLDVVTLFMQRIGVVGGDRRLLAQHVERFMVDVLLYADSDAQAIYTIPTEKAPAWQRQFCTLFEPIHRGKKAPFPGIDRVKHLKSAMGMIADITFRCGIYTTIEQSRRIPYDDIVLPLRHCNSLLVRTAPPMR